MRSITLKRIILALSLMIGLIIIAQIFWLNRLYTFEQRQFNTNVVKAIRGLYEDLELVKGSVVPLQQFIDRPDANTFRIRADYVPPTDSLAYYLTAELQDLMCLRSAISLLTMIMLYWYSPTVMLMC